MSVIIFPEGTRSKDARLLPFKKGAFRLAIDAGVPVLPVAISGTAAGFTKGGTAVGPCDAVARILAPIPTAGLTQNDAGGLRDRVRAAFVAVLPPEMTAPLGAVAPGTVAPGRLGAPAGEVAGRPAGTETPGAV
jgi:1-acyl-sn-glycerol-3-phosphate acyltransferase